MRPTYLQGLAVVAVGFAIASASSSALPPLGWYTLTVAMISLALNALGLRLAARREEREFADREELRHKEARQAEEREAKRLARLAEFKELPGPPEALLSGRSFVWEWPAGWEQEAGELTADPQTDEECVWIMLATWSVPGASRRPRGFERSRPGAVIPVRLRDGQRSYLAP